MIAKSIHILSDEDFKLELEKAFQHGIIRGRHELRLELNASQAPLNYENRSIHLVSPAKPTTHEDSPAPPESAC